MNPNVPRTDCSFDYYAALADNGKDAHNELEVHNITYNAYTEFARDCVICDACPLNVLDIIWTAVNALPQDAQVRQLDRWNHQRTMCRHEFLQALVRIAVELFVVTGAEPHLVAAVARFCSSLRASLPPEALQDSNVFRVRYCYLELTDQALRSFETSLKAIFDVYARANRNQTDELQDAHQMSVGEWMALLEHVGLLSTGQISYFGVRHRRSSISRCLRRIQLLRHYCGTPSHAKVDRVPSPQAKMIFKVRACVHRCTCICLCTITAPLAHRPLQHASCLGTHTVLHRVCAQWSIIRACRDHSAKEERKMRQLTFIDFLEAVVHESMCTDSRGQSASCVSLLQCQRSTIVVRAFTSCAAVNAAAQVRLACTIALPTDAELTAANATDAGEFLNGLQDAGASELDKWISQHKVGWRSEPRQHVGRCVTHLVSVLVRTVKHDVREFDAAARAGTSSADGRSAVSETEAAKFEQRRRSGRTLSHVQSSASLLDGVRASASIVRGRLLTALRKVELFRSLSAAHMEALCKVMVDAPYQHGRHVFEQGDDGDAFYVITEGVAAVVRTEPGSSKEHILATLGEGSYFGERALLRNQVRYAGVRAESARLFTLRVTRANFERALGGPLASLIPDRYRLDETELLERLGSVQLLQSLSQPMLKRIADRCTDASFKQGTDVVQQGDAGDTFYIVTRGTADVLRLPEGCNSDEKEPRKLASLGPWDTFGERALIMDESRYASVRVTSNELHLMSISRAVMEAALGQRLGDLVKYWSEWHE